MEIRAMCRKKGEKVVPISVQCQADRVKCLELAEYKVEQQRNQVKHQGRPHGP